MHFRTLFLHYSAAFILISGTGIAQKSPEEKATIHYRDNDFLLANNFGYSREADTIFRDWGRDTASMEISFATVERINGAPLQSERNDTIDRRVKKLRRKDETLFDYVFKQLAPLLSKLDSGEYVLPIVNVVVNDEGRIIFYQSMGIQKITREYFLGDSSVGDLYWNGAHEPCYFRCGQHIVVTCTLDDEEIPYALKHNINRAAKKLIERTRLTPMGSSALGYWCFDLFGMDNKIEVLDDNVTILYSMPRIPQQHTYGVR